MCACVHVCVTHYHETHDKLGIKKDELHMCCCRPTPRVYFDIVVLVCGIEYNFEKGENVM